MLTGWLQRTRSTASWLPVVSPSFWQHSWFSTNRRQVGCAPQAGRVVGGGVMGAGAGALTAGAGAGTGAGAAFAGASVVGSTLVGAAACSRSMWCQGDGFVRAPGGDPTAESADQTCCAVPAAHLSLQHGAPLSSACRACQEEDGHGLHGQKLGERPAIRRLLIRMGLGNSKATKALLRKQIGPTNSGPTLSAEEWREGCLTSEGLGHTEPVMQAETLMKC